MTFQSLGGFNNAGGGGGGTVTAVTGHSGIVSSGGATPDITPTYGTTANTIGQGNDSRFSDSRAPNGSAGGSLAGTYPNPTHAASNSDAVTWNGAQVFAALHTIQGQLIASGVNALSLATDQNDWAPANLSTAIAYRINATTSMAITGIAQGTSGRFLILYNANGSNTITLRYNSNGSAAANRIVLSGGTDYVMANQSGVILYYDPTWSTWVMIAHS